MRPLLRPGFPYAAPSTPAGVETLPVPKRTGPDYETAWARRFPARFSRLVLLESVMRPAMRALADPDRRGLDRLSELADQGRPVIFAANHNSHVDTPLVLTSIPEPWRHRTFVGAAADYFFRTRLTSAAAALTLNAVPIERTKVSRRSARRAATLIDAGWSMLIFPEGGRSPDGWGQPFRGGAAYLSLRCGVPVVPVHVGGTSGVLAKGARRPRRARTTVTFGAALVPDATEDSRRFGARLERAVEALADEAVTDWYTARQRAHHGETPGLRGPGTTSWRRAGSLGARAGGGGAGRGRPRPCWPDLG